MSTSTSPRRDLDLGTEPPHRMTTETKASIETTELYVFAAMVLAVVLTANFSDGNGAGVPFGAAEAIRYVGYLTIGYLVARGLAKSGSSERYDV